MFASIAFCIAATPPKEPRWLDRMVAGYALQYDDTHGTTCVFDAKSKYFILRDVECDGADISVILTRDRNIVAGQGYHVPGFTPRDSENGDRVITNKPLPSLATGKGVRIGDGPSRVERILGKPRRIEHSGSRKQFLDFLFTWSDYTERYTFKAGKLIEISFARESGPE
jgi:hypothetical protein